MDKYKYIVSKRLEIAGCHQLDLPYESPCRESKHGHNWIVTIHIGSNDLINGMVLDFEKTIEPVHAPYRNGRCFSKSLSGYCPLSAGRLHLAGSFAALLL